MRFVSRRNILRPCREIPSTNLPHRRDGMQAVAVKAAAQPVPARLGAALELLRREKLRKPWKYWVGYLLRRRRTTTRSFCEQFC